jgi:hypothetical protein
MKTIILMIIISLGLLKNLSAQTSFSLNLIDTSKLSGTNTLVAIEGTLSNTSTAAIQMKMQLLNIAIPNDWEIVMCDPSHCHLPGTVFSVFSMNQNQVSPIFVDFRVGNTAGIGTATVLFQDLSNWETSIRFLKVDASITGVTNYSMTEKIVTQTEWFNIQGQSIHSIKEVPKGIYIQRLHFDDGTSFSSKIYVNHY